MRLLALLPLVLATACAAAPPSRPSPASNGVTSLGARCTQGFAADCRTLGRARLLGDGLPEDGRLAAALLVAACEMGDPGACGDVAVLHATGRGLPQDDAVAAALSRRACAEGSALACSNEGVLLAAGVAGADPRGEGDRPARAARLFHAACAAGAPEGCLNLGAAQEHGEGLPRDAGAAAAAYRRACEAGLGLGCHRLAELLAERPELARDLPATLELRACRAGIAPACDVVNERPPELGPRAPPLRLVDDRASFALGIPGAGGVDPGELAAMPVPALRRRNAADAHRPPRAVQEAVPPALRPRLELDGPPRDDDAADAAVELLVALRREELGRCYEAPRRAPGRADVWIVFVAGADGHTEGVRAAGAPEDEALEACAREVVQGWEFPAGPQGRSGPHLARYEYEPAPDGPAPALDGPGSLRPAPRDPSCLARTLEVPPAYRGAAGRATVKLAVGAGGAPALLHALTPLPEPILVAIRAAVRRCEWTPGADARGEPIPAWVTLTVNLAGR